MSVHTHTLSERRCYIDAIDIPITQRCEVMKSARAWITGSGADTSSKMTKTWANALEWSFWRMCRRSF